MLDTSHWLAFGDPDLFIGPSFTYFCSKHSSLLGEADALLHTITTTYLSMHRIQLTLREWNFIYYPARGHSIQEI